MKRVFVDMDGVLVDFERYMRENDQTGDEVKRMPGAYLLMHPVPYAIAAVCSLIGMGLDVWLATKPPTGVPHAYSEKYQWVMDYLPELKRKVIMTHHKGLLGDHGDVLIDDRPHKAHCDEFPGLLITHVSWEDTMEQVKRWHEHVPVDTQRSAAMARVSQELGIPARWLQTR